MFLPLPPLPPLTHATQANPSIPTSGIIAKQGRAGVCIKQNQSFIPRGKPHGTIALFA